MTRGAAGQAVGPGPFALHAKSSRDGGGFEVAHAAACKLCARKLGALLCAVT